MANYLSTGLTIIIIQQIVTMPIYGLGSPQYLSSVHDRYPAIYVNDHIWKCTAGFFHCLFGGHFEKRGSFSGVLRKF